MEKRHYSEYINYALSTYSHLNKLQKGKTRLLCRNIPERILRTREGKKLKSISRKCENSSKKFSFSVIVCAGDGKISQNGSTIVVMLPVCNKGHLRVAIVIMSIILLVILIMGLNQRVPFGHRYPFFEHAIRNQDRCRIF